jgi:radical SAM superfamily enzyme YgiQ (UPF0313 family)
VDTIDESTLLVMKESGCKLIAFGVESGSQKILDTIDKKITVEKSLHAINLCKKVGLRCLTYWIIGLPGTFNEQLKSIEIMKKAQPDVIEVHICSVYPGTDLWCNCRKYGIHINFDRINWNEDLEITSFKLDYMSTNQVFEIANMMKKEMKALGYRSKKNERVKEFSNTKVIDTFI